MSGRQGFITNHETYVYQEAPGDKSAAFGLDSLDSFKWKLKVQQTAGAIPTGTCHIIIDSQANGNFTFTPNGSGKLAVAYMGVGAVLSSASGEMTSSTPGVAGTILMSNGIASAPTWQSMSSSMQWTRQTGTPVTLVADYGYIQANSGAGLTTFTLPATAALGTIIEIVGESSGGWTITQGAGQQIQFGSQATTLGVGGSLSSTDRYDTVVLRCRIADTVWSVTSAVGNLTVI